MKEYAHHHEETLSQAPTLRDTLINTTFAPHRAIDPTIQRIALGELQQEVDLLRGLIVPGSFQEHGKLFYVTSRRTLLIPTKVTPGAEGEVGVDSGATLTMVEVQGEKMHTQDRFMGALVHTHPIDLPFSPHDLGGLFRDDEDPFAHTAEWIITSQQTMLMFRGENTPEWDRVFIDERVTAWNDDT